MIGCRPSARGLDDEPIRRRRLAGLLTVLLLPVAALSTACADRPSELAWREHPGGRWAELPGGGRGRTGFSPLSPSRTGISFENRVTDEHVAANRHTLNGSGVAAGDVDGDGRVDLYFARLDGPNALYRNRGGFAFEDITDSAGVAHDGRFSTGVALADVDGDADLDLLVGSLHDGVTLYLNDGRGAFREAPDAGLGSTAGRGNTTLALADVDGDGDLDLYVTNYREDSIDDRVDMRTLTWKNTVAETRVDGRVEYTLRPPYDDYYTILSREGELPERREAGEPDQLFLGDGKGGFTEVADTRTRFLTAAGEPMGLQRDWGLAAKFQDLNGDGAPDLYVANDFWTPDRIWINDGTGVFRQIDPFAVRSLSFSAMAVDFSDIDRDGHIDVFVTEMLSARHERRARHYVPDEPYPETRFETAWQPQYNRNSLYVSRGDGTYAETAQYSGVAASEWSWATGFVDADLDGYEDLLVATGFSYDLQDLDTQLRMHREIAQGVRPSRGHLLGYPPLELVNRAYRNNGDLTFSDVSDDWGFEEADISHALALADLDDDGDLDLAINRQNRVAAIYENTGAGPRIAVRLRGPPPNTAAVGAVARMEGGPVRQEKEVVAGGGYLSASDPLLVFAATPDAEHTLIVDWPDGGTSTIGGLRANRTYDIMRPAPGADGAAMVAGATRERPQGSGSRPAREAADGVVVPMFEDVSDRLGHIHHEDPFDDWWLQPLLPVGLSRRGPGVSWIDFDQDGDEDLFIAGGRGGRVGAFENLGAGRFERVALGPVTDALEGDATTVLGWGAAEASALVLGSANLEQGNVGAPAALVYAVGPGGVAEDGRVPDNRSTTGPMAAADYDGDGDLDLFVGGNFIPAQYPLAATSRLFRNDGGRLVADAASAPVFRDVGLVTGAVFSDTDGDGDPDLVVSLEWGPLRLFRNEDGAFVDASDEVGLSAHRGWWSGVATGDFNADGRPDLVATNWGRNSPYRLQSGHPLRMYYHDFDWDRRIDIIEAYHDDAAGGYVPRRQFDALRAIATSLGGLRTHREFATATVEEILGPRADRTPFLEINTLDHTLFLNDGRRFVARPLPATAQLSSAAAVAVADYDSDGHEDVFLGQNLFYVRPGLPRHDAGRGLWLRGDGVGGFRPVPGQVSGIAVYGPQRGAAVADFDGDGRVDLAVAQNGGETRLFRNRSERSGLRVRLVGPAGNRDGIGTNVRIVYRDGSTGPSREVQAGSGYWSQNGAIQVLGTAPLGEPARVEVTWFDGTRAAVGVPEARGTVVIRHPDAAAVRD
ncbi:MAG: VCBS repeat-containing protein [Gemmatimonadetes bacterium]|nr:VCBS repeat-containing protein [Gemmatimonadota bacterium]